MTNDAKKKRCFVISPIGSDGSPERRRADLVLKHIFRGALEPLAYEIVRADEISQPGSITLQVVERVLQSELVIADLTDQNPNVFYELAVRHASGGPVIHVIQAGQKIPFDIADLRTIHMDLDLDGAERARTAVAAHAKEIEAGHVGENPVKLAGVVKHLESGKSEEKIVLKQILDSVTETRGISQYLIEQQRAYLTKALGDLALNLQRTIADQAEMLMAVQARKSSEDSREPGSIQLYLKFVEGIEGGVTVSLGDGEKQIATELLKGGSWAKANIRPGQYQLILDGYEHRTGREIRRQQMVRVSPGEIAEVELAF